MEVKHVLRQYPHITETDNEEVKEFLSTLSHGDLEQIVIDYNCILKVSTIDNPLSLHMIGHLLSTRSEQIDKVRSSILSYFDLYEHQIRIVKVGEDTNRIKVCIPMIEENLQRIQLAFDLFGYYLATPKEQLHQGQFTWLLFEYRPLKDDTDRIRKEETTLYFLLPYRKIGMIRHLGFFPPNAKNELFDCPRRLYFLKGSTSKEEIKRICSLKRDANTYISNIDRFALYTIDLNKIPSDAKLYLDPNNSYGIYTPNVVSQDAIINMEELKI